MMIEFKAELKRLLAFEGINYFIRNLLKILRFPIALRKRIRINGRVGLCFNGINFTMYAKQDDIIVDQFYNNQWDEVNCLKHFLLYAKKSNVILDIGANTGLYSILSSLVNSKAKIHSFEPYEANANRLKLNLQLNKLNNVQVHNYGVSDANTSLNLFIPEGEQRISQVSSFNEEFTKSHKQNDIFIYNKKLVQIKTIDSLKLESVDLIKIDVESHEVAVLKGAMDTIKRFRPVLLVEIFPNPQNCTFFKNFLTNYDYKLYSSEDFKIKKVSQISSAYSNYFLLPSEKIVK
ncbi:MAG: FkbM family methyltransferase [Fulvivirga sp.]|uniref:FkbM family methyltransferase n=1 Tax=Fulvivirga sp. TaxID=1931237 RepID=UPI0032EE136A